MKTHLSILVQIVSLLLLSQLSFSQELVEVKLGGDAPSDAFIVRNGSGSTLLTMDGYKNFGVNSQQPNGIDIRGRNGGLVRIFGGSVGSFTSGSVQISGGNGGSVHLNGGSGDGGGDIDIIAGYGSSNGGGVNIGSGGGISSGNINVYTASSNNMGGSIALTASEPGNITLTTEDGGDIVLSSGLGLQLETIGNPEGSDGITLKTSFSDSGENNIWLTVGGCDGTEDCPRGIILNPNVGLVEIIGSGTYTGTWTQASDERYKSNIKPISGILNKVEMLKPVEYEWNKEEYPENNFPDGNQIGLVAQEVEKLFPELVATNQDGYKSIDYSKISVLLIHAIKEQQNEIEKQYAVNEKQSDEIEKQSEEIDKIKSELEELKFMILQDSNRFSSNDNLFKED